MLYHGTNSDFEAFGAGAGNAAGEAGTVFASTSREDAEEFGRMKGGDVRLLTVEVDLVNPLVVDAGGEVYDPEMMTRYVREARDNGNDGIIIRRIVNFEFSDPSTSYVAFRPEAVRIVSSEAV